MLVIRRRAGEKIYIGDDIEIEIIEAGTGRVRVGVTAPREVPVVRGEARLTRQQNSLAASVTADQISGLLSQLQTSESDPGQISSQTSTPRAEEDCKAALGIRQEA